MRMEKRFLKLSAIVLVSLLIVSLTTMGVVAGAAKYPTLRRVPTPKEYLGYNIGDDYCLTPWDKIVGYMKAIDDSSKRVKVFEVGKTTNGRPMIIVAITAEENWARISFYRSIIEKLSDPHKTSPSEALYLSKIGKPIFWISCNIHSPEVGSAEMSMDLAYKLASSTEPEVKEILDNLIIIINPSLNPDGHDWLTEWYYKYLGTPYELTSPPYYQEYVSHDNNRDWICLKLVETNVMRPVVLDWKPTVFVDLHEAGRMLYISPGPDPTYPEVDPIIQAGWIMFAGWIMEQMIAMGFKGVNTACYADMWFPGYTHEFATFRNAIGLFFETAAGQRGTPVYIRTPYRWGSSEVNPGVTENASWNNPAPFKGGWWTLRDDVIYQETGVWLIMQLMARFPEKFLSNYYTIARNNVVKGQTQPPYAYLVPPDQKDPFAAADMINTLLKHGVEVHKAVKGFVVDGTPYPAGTYIIRMDQPYRAIAKTLLEVQVYPPVDTINGLIYKTPYDITGWTFKYLYGVDTIEVKDPSIFDVPMKLVTDVKVEGKIVGGTAGYAYVIERVPSISAKVLNTLFEKGLSVYESTDDFVLDGKTFKKGSLIIPVQTNVHKTMNELVDKFGITVYAAHAKLSVNVLRLEKPRVAIYEPWGSSSYTMDLGWTRLILDEYEFTYQRIWNKDIRETNLRERFDAIIIPEISVTIMYTGPSAASYPDPPEHVGYRGMGSAGVANLKKFVEEGGTLITIGGSCSLPITYFANFKLKVDTVSNPIGAGTIIKMLTDNNHPIAYGYGTETPIMYTSSPVFKVVDPTAVEVVGWYSSTENPQLSGFLKYPERILGYAGLVDVKLGEGNVVLYGFRPQYRAMTEGTFMLLFNAVYDSTAVPATLP